MDLNGNYGGLGAAMQAVKWDYYGNVIQYLQHMVTKFAADNWMHKMMGIQLGLTHSVRCQLPARNRWNRSLEIDCLCNWDIRTIHLSLMQQLPIL